MKQITLKKVHSPPPAARLFRNPRYFRFFASDWGPMKQGVFWARNEVQYSLGPPLRKQEFGSYYIFLAPCGPPFWFLSPPWPSTKYSLGYRDTFPRSPLLARGARARTCGR